MYASPRTADLLPKDEAARLGVLANSVDQFDLMRAIERCDELVSQLRAVQLVHSQNMCRVANRLASVPRVPGCTCADYDSARCPVHDAERVS